MALNDRGDNNPNPSATGIDFGNNGRGERRPATASDGQMPATGIGPRPESSSTFNVDWQIVTEPGGGQVGGNPAAMDLYNRVRNWGRTMRGDGNGSTDR